MEAAIFLCQPLLDVLAGRGIEDIDAFLKVPSWNDLPDPFATPSMEKAATRVLSAVRNRERIAIHGDYDCDGVLGTHILRSVLTGLGAAPRAYLPHRDEGYGLSPVAVHRFSCGAVVIDHDYINPEPLRQPHGSPRVDSVIDRASLPCALAINCKNESARD